MNDPANKQAQVLGDLQQATSAANGFQKSYTHVAVAIATAFIRTAFYIVWYVTEGQYYDEDDDERT